MGGNCGIPGAEAVARLFGDLIGKDVPVERCKAFALAPRSGATAAVFHTEHKKVGAVLILEIGASAAAGAALTSMPATAVEEQVVDAKLSATLLENFREVMNIGAQLFQGTNAPRVAFSGLYQNPEPLPADVAAVLSRPAARIDYKVTIPGYGSGRIAVLIAPQAVAVA
ncbi:MAG: hypothetical protein JNJ88_17500 [Planctomycetes bacterium]|nr:hypothetical protein [Planctomycetota bacterium]